MLSTGAAFSAAICSSSPMVDDARGDDRVIAGEGARDVLDASRACRCRPRPSGGRPDGRRAAPPPSPSSCGCARSASRSRARRPCPASSARRSAARTRRGSLAGRPRDEVADGEQMLHQLASRLTIVPTPWSVSSSISSAWWHAAVDDVREADALIDRVGAGAKLGDHALADAFMLDPLAKLGGGQPRDQAGLVLDILEQARRGGQIDDLLRLHRHGDRPRRLVGVDVVGLAVRIRRRPSRRPASARRRAGGGAASARTSVTLPTKPSAESRGVTVSRPASSPDTPTATGSSPASRLIVRDEVAVDLADQHHADDLERLGVGDAKAVAELRLLADPAQHRVDLRPAAMDEHAAHADAAQQQHVLRQRPVGLACRSPRRRASPPPTCRRTGGCRAAPRRGRARFRPELAARHDVLLFSLM